MRTFILLFLLFSSHHLIGQTNWSFDQKIEFDRYTTYKGTINNKYPITMYLEESSQTCNDEYSRRSPRIVYGWYMYDKIGKKIPIVGHACYADACESFLELFVPEDPVNFSFDENCKLKGAKEIFSKKQHWESGKFEWQMKGGQKYPVHLETVHEFSWTTKASLLLRVNGIEIGTFDLNELTENNYIEQIELLGQKRSGNKFHLLFKFSHPSNPGSFGFGMCGAGLEEYIAHLVVDKNFETESFEKIQTHSCIYSTDYVDVIYDENKPELGIKKSEK